MSNQVIVDLFVEDRAHESFLEPLLMRIAREQDIAIEIRVRSARGGHGRAIAEFELYQKFVTKSLLGSESADIVVVAIDGNCSTPTVARRRIQDATDLMLIDRLVIACPDPHIERWYVADPDSFETIVGHRPSVGDKKCARGHYKQILTTARPSDYTRWRGHTGVSVTLTNCIQKRSDTSDEVNFFLNSQMSQIGI